MSNSHLNHTNPSVETNIVRAPKKRNIKDFGGEHCYNLFRRLHRYFTKKSKLIWSNLYNSLKR